MMPQDDLTPLIAALERRVDDAERKASDLRGALNVLRAEAELPPRPPGHVGNVEPMSSSPAQIKNDTFFGKRQQTAVREYLELRRAVGEGPAKPRDIYDALVAGGYKYKTKDAGTALVGLRAMLRKRSSVFIKVGEGAYGLLSWYPDARKPKETAPPKDDTSGQDEDNDLDTETAADDETASA